MFKALEMFTDLQDNNYKYEVGDEYPRLGLKPSLARIKELSGSDNLRGRAVIEEVDDMAQGEPTATTATTATTKKKGGRKPKKED